MIRLRLPMLIPLSANPMTAVIAITLLGVVSMAIPPVATGLSVRLADSAPTLAPPVDTLVGAVQERVADGERLKDAVRVVAEAAGVGKRELYAATLAGRELDGAGSTS